MLETAFWFFLLAMAYVYFGYPLLLFLAALLPRRAAGGDDDHLPSVTLIISAFNEEECIAEKLKNSLAIDYPKSLIEIIVVSDASDDRTDSIVEEFAQSGVSLLRMEDRGGKTLGLNAGVSKARGEIVVFSDANAMYQPDAIKALVREFADDRVGAAIGESSYLDPESSAGQSEGLYWKYETTIKKLENKTGSVVGGDGAIYAVRKALYEPMKADDLSDFVNPLQVVKKGYLCRYVPDAVSWEETAESYTKEYRRKVRIVNRAWRATWRHRELLNPLRFGGFALKFWSHKLLRWFVPFFMLLVFVLNLALLNESWFYVATMLAQLAFYALAVVGYLTRRSGKQPILIFVPFYFCLVNLACAIGIIEFLSGKSYTTWTTARADSPTEKQS